jgi:hypothetical protein
MAFPRKDEGRATPYRVGLDVLQSHTKPREHSSLLALFRLNLQQPPPDLFCGKQGLSKAVLRAYEALDPERPQKVAPLAKKLGRHRSSVGRSLKQLAAFDLAVNADDGWRKLDADLEKLAEKQGTAGTTERKRAYHESLRPGHRAYLEHKRGNSNGEGSRSEGVRPAKGTMVSEARAARRPDRGTALPRRSAEPVSGNHGQ